MDFSFVSLTQNDKIRHHCQMTKCIFLAVIASEQGERGNPQGKGNAKFMACHAIFAKTARNDRRKKPKNKAFKNFSVPKSASNEREREKSRPNTAPTFALLALSANTRHTEFAVLNFIAVPLNFATLCRFVVKLATPRCVRFAKFSAHCQAPLRPKSSLCHATPHAKFSPHAQGASTATLKGIALR